MAELNLAILTFAYIYVRVNHLPPSTFVVLSVCVRILHSPLHHPYIGNTTMYAAWYTTVSFMTGNGPMGLFAVFHVYIHSNHAVIEFHWSAITMWLRTCYYVNHWMLCSSQTIVKSSTQCLPVVYCWYFFSATTTQPHQPHMMHWSTVMEVKQCVWMSAQKQETRWMWWLHLWHAITWLLPCDITEHSRACHDSMPEGPCPSWLVCVSFLQLRWERHLPRHPFPSAAQ